MIRVVIVDDHTLVRQGLVQLLALAGEVEVVVQAGNTGLFSGIYKDAAAFNQSMFSSVSAAAGLNAEFSNSLIGQLVDQAA